MPMKRTRLAARRKVIGFSQDQLAERLRVEHSTVARWESGKTEPQPWVRPQLAKALQVSVEQLDELLSEGNPAASETDKKRLDQTPVHRSSLDLVTATSFTAVGLNPADKERMRHATRRPMRVDAGVASPLLKMLAAQREIEDAIGSSPLVRSVTGQLAMIENLVRETRGPVRPVITDVGAQWAEYAGWIHASMGNGEDALAWFERALGWSMEADNASLAAHALSFKGYVYFMLGQIGPMIGVAQAAQQETSAWIGQRAYDAYLEARGLALLGDTEAAARKVGEGDERVLLAREHIEERPPWNYYCTPAFYALERGLVYRFLGRNNPRHNEEAIGTFRSALDGLGDARASEWAADYMCHLAVAYMQAGAPDKACETASEVLQVALATKSTPLIGRLRAAHARLTRQWPSHPCVVELGEALGAEPGGSSCK
jgi:transcriptional regulator with XRE-family HTH domain